MGEVWKAADALENDKLPWTHFAHKIRDTQGDSHGAVMEVTCGFGDLTRHLCVFRIIIPLCRSSLPRLWKPPWLVLSKCDEYCSGFPRLWKPPWLADADADEDLFKKQLGRILIQLLLDFQIFEALGTSHFSGAVGC